jgi:hypothetical protein
MRLLVCGGRNYADYFFLVNTLNTVDEICGPIRSLIQGEASGADALAACWATMRRIHIAGFPAEWSRHGRNAGPIRNQLMLDVGKPNLVIAFPGGLGTANMVSKAKLAGVKTISVGGINGLVSADLEAQLKLFVSG